MFTESQKKRSNNQDDSDEDDDDDDEAGPSTQQAGAVQPQAGYAAPMPQLGMPPVAGAPGMHPGGYQGKESTLIQHYNHNNKNPNLMCTFQNQHLTVLYKGSKTNDSNIQNILKQTEHIKEVLNLGLVKDFSVGIKETKCRLV